MIKSTLASLLVFWGFLLTGGQAAAQPGNISAVARLVGIDLGVPLADLQAVTKAAGLVCQIQQADAYVCRGSLGKTPLPVTTTFWMKDGHLDRVYEVATLNSGLFSDLFTSQDQMRQRAQQILDIPAIVVEGGFPPWFAPLNNAQRMMALSTGRLGFETQWPLDEIRVSVSLRGERGRPLLLTSVDRNAGCSAGQLNEALLNLFAPAPAELRAASARQLAACREPRSAGALGVMLAQDDDEGVRVMAARALGGLANETARAALAEAATSQSSPLVRVEAVRGLVRTNDVTVPLVILADTKAEDVLRAQTLRALAAAGRANQAVIDSLAQGAGPALKAEIVAVETALINAPVGPVVVAEVPQQAVAETPLLVPRTSTTTRVSKAPARPVKPPVPSDGTALAITTSLAAGGVWGGALSLMAQQNSVGVITLVGGAGAIIGGGTAWGLTRLNLRPTPAQALWYTNSTGWGVLGGLMVYAGSGMDNPKLKYGLLVGGESAGIVAGVWSARRWSWTPAQVLLADSLVLGAGLAGSGFDRIQRPDGRLRVSPAAGYGAVPAMVAAAVASRYLQVSKNDLHLMGTSAVAAGWTGALLGAGLAQTRFFEEGYSQGGLMLGLGAGYLGSAAAISFVEIDKRRVYASSVGVLAGNVLGLGAHMVANPTQAPTWKLGAGLGGVGLGVATFLAYPYVKPGPQVTALTLAGSLYGAGVWTLALKAASTGQPPDARVPGGMLIGSVTAGTAGLVASQYFHPDGWDQLTTATTTGIGIGAGLGVSKLVTSKKGLPEFVGVMGGAALGFSSGIFLTQRPRLRPPEVAAGFTGAGYGVLMGSLIPTLHLQEWNDGRKTAGGSWLGLSAGAVGGAALARMTNARGAQVGVASAATVLGAGMGLGAGLIWPSAGSRSGRIGTVAGGSAMLLTSILAEPKLRLSEGLGPNAAGLALWGAGIGMFHGRLSADVVRQDQSDALYARMKGGGTLLGTTAGLTTGLVLSKWAHPSSQDYVAVAGAGLWGHSLGAGLSDLFWNDGEPGPDRRGPILSLGGALVGTAAAAGFAHGRGFRNADLAAGIAGTGYGALIGTLAPTLGHRVWDGGRRGVGGANLGLALGGAGAAVAANLTDASAAQISVPIVGAGLGLGAGLGFGLMLPSEGSQAARVGTFTGSLVFLGGSLVLDRPLRLSAGSGSPQGRPLFVTGALWGATNGVLLAGAADSSGLVSEASSSQIFGGMLFGASMGGTSGLVLSRFFQPRAADNAAAFAGSAFGAGIGVGTSMLLTGRTGRSDTTSALAGSLGGMALAVGTQNFSPLTTTDATAIPVGLGFGAVFGALGPTLGDATWPGWTRSTGGGLALGTSGGAVTAVVLRHATDVAPRTIGLAAAGGTDGLLTGLGVGMLFDRDGESRGTRTGAVIGTGLGLGLGAVAWPRTVWGQNDSTLVLGLSALGGWNGLWIPALGHADKSDADTTKMMGGFLAGAGGGSFLAMALAPGLELDNDLMINGLAMNALMAGAGAGVGVLASPRDDAPVWGLLGGGATGLVLGGAFHNAIDLDAEDRPLLTLAALQGSWYGAWLPHLLYEGDDVTGGRQLGGLAAGALGATAVGVLASPWFKPDAADAGFAGLGSVIGASMAGGAALISDDLEGRRGVGLMLGGTTVGLAGGAWLAPRLTLASNAVSAAALGATLGASEGLVFAWAGRADGGADYLGAGLVGAGLGTTLGLAMSTSSGVQSQQNMSLIGLSAWGAWMGSFGGALVNRNSHEVTLGGLVGTNAGFLAGYGLLKSELVEPRDFGWLSLFGAAGTVAGGGVGAVLSSRENPRPVLAGLAIGPLVGMGVGAFVLPRLHRLDSGTSVSGRFASPSRFASLSWLLPKRQGTAAALPASTAASITSSEMLAAKHQGRTSLDLGRKLKSLFDVAAWTPVVGALPKAQGAPSGPVAFTFGVAGQLQ